MSEPIELRLRPTRDPGLIDTCPVCGRRLPSDPWPGCYWGRFSRAWICVWDNPMLGRSGG